MMYRGRCWPRDFQQCLFKFVKCLPLFAPKILMTFCIYNIKRYSAASRLYGIFVLLQYTGGFIYTLLTFSHIRDLGFYIFNAK